jgi:hypothetical protein
VVRTIEEQGPWHGRAIERRTILQAVGGALVGTALAGALPTQGAEGAPVHTGAAATELQPRDAFQALIQAMEHYPLVGLGERHMLQEMHDFFTALLHRPDLPRTLTDIVVEFGNAYYQDLADRFVLSDQPVARADLVQIWRQIGDPAWNAPVYEQFFRTVRAINWMRQPAQRIRILLGQPPVTMSQLLARPTDSHIAGVFEGTTDDHYAAVIEQQVLAKGRRALLLAGSGHLARGIRADDDKPGHPNAITQVLGRRPGVYYGIDLFMLPPKGTPVANPKAAKMADELQRIAAKFKDWPRPAVASVAGTWLGNTTVTTNTWINGLGYRALVPAGSRFGAQTDAILYLGPGEVLTASQPDPSLYHWGAYPDQLRRASALAHAGDQVAYGEHWATVDPSWFLLFG